MKKTLLLISLLFCATFIFAQSNAWQWAKQVGDINADYCYDIATDSSGNSYVIGYFSGSATFGGTTFTSRGSNDIFVAKLNSNGEWQWAKQAGGTSDDFGLSIAIDSYGYIYITGNFSGSATFGDPTYPLSAKGEKDIFVAKLDSDGNWLWAQKAGGLSYDWGYSIATDSWGNSYITGFFQDTVTFRESLTLTSSGGFDIFVAKLDSSGNWLWAQKAGGANFDYGRGIATDSSGNCYVTGYFSGSATIGSTTFTGIGSNDIFIAKLNSNGAWQWSKQAGGSLADEGWNIATDSSGNSYVTGCFAGTVNFGKTQLISSGTDIFVVKLNSNGEWQWAKKAGGNNTDYGYGIAIDSSGNCYVTGYFQSTATFGSINLASNGGSDIFVAKLDSSGNWLWAQKAGGGSADQGYGISTDSSGNSYITGYFNGTATFGNNISLYSNNNSQDIFVTKVHIPYFPNDVYVVEETTGLKIKVFGGDAERGNLDGFPPIPNQADSFKKLNIILNTGISTSWTITILTSNTYGAYYLNNRWNVVSGNGTQIVFSISFSGTKGEDIGIPIIVGNENPLPVELSSFTAYVNPQNKINIMWTTQTETGLLGFYVMCSTQNELFTAEVISPLISATNTSEPRTYLYTDTEVTESGTYYYWLQCNDLDGTIKIFGSISIDYNPNDSSNTPSILVTELQPVYPNPFNPIAYIPFTLETKSEVKFIIYNTRGQIVKTFDLGSQEKGHHRITWDGRDNDGNLSGNGIYYIVMKAGKESFQRKAVLMK